MGDAAVQDVPVDAVVARVVAGRRQVEIDRQGRPARHGRRLYPALLGRSNALLPRDVRSHPLVEGRLKQLAHEIVDRREFKLAIVAGTGGGGRGTHVAVLVSLAAGLAVTGGVDDLHEMTHPWYGGQVDGR